MSSKTSSKTSKSAPSGKFGAFDLLMPKMANEPDGFELAAGNYVRITGSVPALLQAARLSGGSIGVHAAGKGENVSLCKCSLTSATKDASPRVSASGRRDKVAAEVTCRFCLARLVSAGIVTSADDMPKASAKAQAYALRFGSVSVSDALAAIEARAAKAARASKPRAKARAKASK